MRGGCRSHGAWVACAPSWRGCWSIGHGSDTSCLCVLVVRVCVCSQRAGRLVGSGLHKSQRRSVRVGQPALPRWHRMRGGVVDVVERSARHSARGNKFSLFRSPVKVNLNMQGFVGCALLTRPSPSLVAPVKPRVPRPSRPRPSGHRSLIDQAFPHAPRPTSCPSRRRHEDGQQLCLTCLARQGQKEGGR